MSPTVQVSTIRFFLAVMPAPAWLLAGFVTVVPAGRVDGRTESAQRRRGVRLHSAAPVVMTLLDARDQIEIAGHGAYGLSLSSNASRKPPLEATTFPPFHRMSTKSNHAAEA